MDNRAEDANEKVITKGPPPFGIILAIVFGSAALLAMAGVGITVFLKRHGTPFLAETPTPAKPAASTTKGRQSSMVAADDAPPVAAQQQEDAQSVEEARAADFQALLQSGQQALLRGKGHQAVTLLRKATQHTPQASEAWLALIAAYRQVDDLPHAWQTCERALGTITGDQTDVQCAFARLALDGGKPKTALDQATSVLRRNADHGDAHLLAARALLDLSQCSQALLHARQAAAALPDESAAKTVLGRALVANNQAAEALPLLQAALADSPNSPEAALSLARAQRLLGNEEAARAALAQVEAKADTDSDYLLEVTRTDKEPLPPGPLGSDLALAAQAAVERAELRLRNGDKAGAVAAYQELVKAHPKLPSLQYRLAELHLLNNQAAAALGLAKELLETNPDDPGAHTIQARLFLARGLPQLAVEECRAALKSDNRTSITLTARKVLAMSLSRLQQPTEAAEEMRRYLADRPNDVDATVRLAEMLFRAEEHQAALDLLRHAAQRWPEAPNIAAQESLLLYRSGEVTQAAEAMRHAIELGANGIRARLSLAALLIEGGQATEALPVALKVREEVPRNHIAADTVAWCLIQLGRLDEAAPHMEEALRGLPRAPRYRYHHAVLLQRQQRTDEAMAELRVALASPRKYREREATRLLLAELGGTPEQVEGQPN